MSTPDEEEYMTLVEVAVLLRVTRQTVSKYAKNGEIPGAFRIGGWSWRLPKSEVMNYIERQKRKGVNQ